MTGKTPTDLGLIKGALGKVSSPPGILPAPNINQNHWKLQAFGALQEILNIWQDLPVRSPSFGRDYAGCGLISAEFGTSKLC